MSQPTRCIIDNFLPERDLKEIERVLYDQEFPWYTMNGVVYEGDTDKRLAHFLYEENVK